ncbi:phytoene synthase [Rhodococcus wratislaviensis]|uniref:Phytoene synthase n=2 Tax=Rhodococcus wratislaviensis TaxID=44752 RepID=A0AB38FD28_RHOWR|nr:MULTISPECIES: phytoene/squalene synthase family protein [Rhodococcus]REE77117.1 phytoene synthase [Rhodococcus wratislaviensis]WAM14247.1 phytoene/squalene synthase family protein [Rhodococcus sp. JS3073]GAF42600.1 phytoene synthase [Rhodococcus wratislaviensis NBRC 100605]SPZ39227.1 phytoene synthase [Rhodococcus wratislaviensis]
MTELADSYRYCGAVTAEHGRTYHLATRLLPERRRAAVHSLYGFARTVDDIVDVDPGRTAGDCAAELDRIDAALRLGFTCRTAVGPDACAPEMRRVLPAFLDTVASFDIPHDYFFAFLQSMRMDVPGTAEHRAEYDTMTELRKYMYGSAVVIGLQMLPVLGTTGPLADAEPHAAALGEAFQLTNFLRDVGEDLDRGRVYLPADELGAFGVDTELLAHSRRSGTTDRRIVRALAHLISVTRSVYREAEPGIAMLDRRVQPGIRTAFVLYSRILDEIERGGYRVLDRRATVSRRNRWATALPQFARLAVPARGRVR